ncbi:MAG: hypothetical protein U0Q22_00695 [Acidimicrobiales bacterium]
MSGRSLSGAVLDRAVAPFQRRIDRRSLLRRSTMAATAMVAAPTDFLLRPTTAYAAVCGCAGQACPCGSQCCDGYTEFCCTLTGQNGCPPGTVAAGWWKVDGSNFCGGAPRYYLDCNAQCGGCGCSGGICDGSCSGTVCTCANGDCGNRKAGCTKFRYGQCNQHIACLGPITCRVVTCTPPWVFDGSCTTSSRSDNNTAQHYKPCLDAPFGAFDTLTDVGGGIRVTGWAIDQNRRDGVQARLFVDQQPMVTTMADIPRPDVGAAYPYFGDRHGFDAVVPTGPGRHVVCVLAYDEGSFATTFLAFRTIDVAGPLGNLELVAGGSGIVTVSGWAADPFAPGSIATMHLIADGVAVAELTTGGDRPDVAAAVPGVTQQCGFLRDFGFAPGLHSICVDLVYASGLTGRLGCADVVVT